MTRSFDPVVKCEGMWLRSVDVSADGHLVLTFRPKGRGMPHSVAISVVEGDGRLGVYPALQGSALLAGIAAMKRVVEQAKGFA